MLLTVMLLLAAPRLWAAGAAENRAFNAASELFRAAFYAQAEAEFADFIQKFPASTLVPEAVLFEAEARIQTTNYSGAIELLKTHQGTAGTLADEYLFWQAQATLRQGDSRAAGELFAKLSKDFPASKRRLEAVIGQATAQTRLSAWPAVIELLGRTNGLFQIAARTNSASELAARGCLLLTEAQLAQTNCAAAKAALAPLAGRQLAPKLDWQRRFLRCRILLAEGSLDEALRDSAELPKLATAAGPRTFLAESYALQAVTLERLGRLDEAVAAYQKNLAEGFPAERQRQALLKIAELSLAQNKIAEAAQMLEQFLKACPETPSTDLALLTLGELRLRQRMTGSTTNAIAGAAANAPAGTDCLDLALAALNKLTTRFPQSPLFAKAQLDLGWCYWLRGQMPQSQAAFQKAVERLPFSVEQATARYKLADAQFRQNNYPAAITNYSILIQKYADLPQVQTNLFEPALYQTVRAALASADLDVATRALAKIMAWYPTGFYTGRALLLTGQEVGCQDADRARQLFSEFVAAVPNAPLRAQVELAIARTYEQQGLWDDAIRQYESWLARFTNHPARPRAEYSCGWASFQAGRYTNALTCFTNLLATDPTNRFAPLAQWWVADYYFGLGGTGLLEAEKNYQAIYQNTNWPVSRLTYEARMMAGRTAVARQGWKDAKDYFYTLFSNTNCPPELRAQASFAYADCLISQDSTNKLADYKEALSVYEGICESWPTSRVAVLAWGGRANCLLEWAKDPHDYELSTNAFQQVILSPLADAAARSIAKVGLGAALEKLAQQPAADNSAPLLNQALTAYLDVFDGKVLRDGEAPDPFWTKEATLRAAALAEKLQRWEPAIRLWRRLEEWFPPLRARLNEKILKAREQLARDANSN